MNSCVDILIPLYNKEDFIIETLQSVKNQSIPKFKCIIVDDHSTDNSYQLVHNFITGDQRFVLLRRPDNSLNGASSCRNIAFHHSNSKYIQYLDADDVLCKNKLESQLQLLKKSSPLSIATCKWGRFNNQEKSINKALYSYNNFNDYQRFLISLIDSYGYFPLHAYLIPRDLILKIGNWNTKMTLNDDGEFMHRVFTQMNNVLFAADSIAYYREVTATNLSQTLNKKAIEMNIEFHKELQTIYKKQNKSIPKSYLNYSKRKLYAGLKQKGYNFTWSAFWFLRKEIINAYQAKLRSLLGKK